MRAVVAAARWLFGLLSRRRGKPPNGAWVRFRSTAKENPLSGDFINHVDESGRIVVKVGGADDTHDMLLGDPPTWINSVVHGPAEITLRGSFSFVNVSKKRVMAAYGTLLMPGSRRDVTFDPPFVLEIPPGHSASLVHEATAAEVVAARRIGCRW